MWITLKRKPTRLAGLVFYITTFCKTFTIWMKFETDEKNNSSLTIVR